MTRWSLSASIFAATVTILAIGGIFIGVYYEGPEQNGSNQTSTLNDMMSSSLHQSIASHRNSRDVIHQLPSSASEKVQVRRVVARLKDNFVQSKSSDLAA